MLESKKKFIPKLKPYHIILLSIALCPFLIINSNIVNKRREEEAQLKEDHKFLEKLYLRKLDFESDVDAICEKGSDDLKEYYTNGDPESIGIDDDEKIESEDDNPPYITALINLVSSEGEMEQNAKDYVMHLLPVIVFFALAFLSLPIWFIYCICCCSNCCCCCCCKKEICKIPFFIVAAAFYALILGISVYGLSQSNSIFVGLADTECSILKFIGEVLDGETKETKPKWAGINGIKGLFQETIVKIKGINTDTKSQLSSSKSDASTKKSQFESALQTHGNNLSPSSSSAYKQTLNSKDYYLDIIYNFGTFTPSVPATPPAEGTPSSAGPPGSFLWKWHQEFKEITENSERQMDIAYSNYDTLETKSGLVENTLNEGITSISDLEGSFNDIKEQVSDIIISYSDKIDEYGKLAFKIIFSVFMVLDIGIAAFITLLLFCSFKCCKSCCCFKCLFKSLLHILWNILAFLTFFVLLLGSIFTLFGTVGKDLISVVSFLVSDKNLNKEKPILLEQAKNYISICINGNGDISNELNIKTDEMDNVNDLRSAANEINILKERIEYLKDTHPSYDNYKNDYENRINYRIDNFELINNDDGSKLNFGTCLNNLNSKITNGQKWRISCPYGEGYDSCDTSTKTDPNLCINPSTCNTQNPSNWYTSGNAAAGSAEEVTAFINSVKTVKDNLGTILNDLITKYNGFINTQSTSLGAFSAKINDLADLFNKFAGKGSDTSVYSIINCKFIGRNAKIMLKNLKESLGQSFYTVGLCLEISGISMLISIAFTILINSIINANTGK